MEIDSKIKDLFEIFCSNENSRIVTDYSGKGMGGRKCIGFITNKNLFSFGVDFTLFLKDAEEEGEIANIEEIIDSISKNTAIDSFGASDSIIYFPNLTIMNTEDEEEDEDDFDEEEDEEEDEDDFDEEEDEEDFDEEEDEEEEE